MRLLNKESNLRIRVLCTQVTFTKSNDLAEFEENDPNDSPACDDNAHNVEGSRPS